MNWLRRAYYDFIGGAMHDGHEELGRKQIDVNLNVTINLSTATINSLLQYVTALGEEIMAKIDDIVAAVEAQKTVIGSVKTLLAQLSQSIKDAGTDPVKLQKIQDDLAANNQDLSDAVLTNTPAAP